MIALNGGGWAVTLLGGLVKRFFIPGAMYAWIAHVAGDAYNCGQCLKIKIPTGGADRYSGSDCY